MMNQESKPALEDLLRLKRAERPTPEFWTEFDRELRAKQLAALVEKRPWWRTLPRRLRAVARYHLPLGATAVLAVTLLSIRDYQPVSPVQAAGDVSEFDVPDAEQAAARDVRVNTADATDGRAVSAEVAVQTTTPAPALSSDAAAPGELARMLPLLSVGDNAVAELAPSARSIAENRAVAEALLGTTSSSFETRALPARTMPEEPLARMPNPSDTRRSRFATMFASAASTSPLPTARVARRLSDEQLYDSIRRFGASGNSVSFKF